MGVAITLYTGNSGDELGLVMSQAHIRRQSYLNLITIRLIVPYVSVEYWQYQLEE